VVRAWSDPQRQTAAALGNWLRRLYMQGQPKNLGGPDRRNADQPPCDFVTARTRKGPSTQMDSRAFLLPD
jgi:hypothetical protein